MRGEFVLRDVSAPRGTLSLIMSGFDELPQSFCTTGMLVNGDCMHPGMRYDWDSDRSGTNPSNELDLTTMVLGEEVMDEFAMECNAEEELRAELQREFARKM
jgi:hypothetical protein